MNVRSDLNIRCIVVDPVAGASIYSVLREASWVSSKYHIPVYLSFNGMRIVMDSNSDIAEILTDYADRGTHEEVQFYIKDDYNLNKIFK